jgi:uncharacterized protein (DUF2062 family)
MYHFTKKALRRWAEKLLHIHDSPERTAAAFALGIGLGFSPLLGLHTVIGLLLAFTLNLNRVAILVGIYLHLPWFMPAFYTATTALGAWLLGTHMPPGFIHQIILQLEQAWRLPLWPLGPWLTALTRLLRLLRPVLAPYLLGGTIVSTIMGLAAYPLSLSFIRARRKHHHQPPEVAH